LIGDYCCYRKEDDSFEIQGDAGENIAIEMKKGNVSVKNTKGKAGYQMRGGVLRINGNHNGDGLGSEMEGGDIHVRGRKGSFVGDLKSGGNIY